MAIKDIISPGIGFAPGGVKFIVTRGFSTSSSAAAGVGGMFFERIETYSGGADRMQGYTGGADRVQGYTGGADRMETR